MKLQYIWLNSLLCHKKKLYLHTEDIYQTDNTIETMEFLERQTTVQTYIGGKPKSIFLLNVLLLRPKD